MDQETPVLTDDARWARLETLFNEAIDLPPGERAAFVAAQGLDDDLRVELVEMIEADDSTPADSLGQRIGDVLLGAAAIPRPGQLIGRYRLTREIGIGGAGIVFLAERADDHFHQQVAIKVIRGVATGDAVRQLRHERQILAGFEHPGIARLFDGGETEYGQPYLVMEWIEGAPITEAVKQRGLSFRERLKLVREVARAVHYAHQRLVIHRDIKPGNVMLRNDGRPVLLDFGIAKLVDANAQAQSTQTQPWFTPAYASPEQRGGGTASTATDIYALGLLTYELLTDKRPVVAANGWLAAPSAVARGATRAALRGDLDRIIAVATAVDPADRYPSADSFARDLDRYLEGLPVRAAPDRATYRMRKFVRRNPVAVVAAVAMLAMATFFAWRLADERNRAIRAEAIAQKESASSQAVTRYLVGLFRQADPALSRKTLTPTELIDRGVEKLRGDTDIEPAARALLLGTIGEIYQNLGLPQQGSAALAEAASHARQAGAKDVLADALAALGMSLDERGQYAQATDTLREAVGLFRALGDPVQAAETLALQGLAESHAGEYEAAERSLLDAHAALVGLLGRDDPVTITTLAYRTELWRDTGRVMEMKRLLEEAMPVIEAKLAPSDARLMIFYGAYANLLLQLDESAKAQALFERMLKYRREMLESDRSPLGFVHNGLGMLYYQQGRTREAAEQFVLALAIGERSLGPDDPNLALDVNNVASLYEELGDYARAEPLMRRAVRIMEAKSPDSVLTAQYRQNLGRLLMLKGHAPDAFDWLSKPIDAAHAGDGWQLQRARQTFHLAEWHRRYGRPADAWREVEDLERRVDDLGGRESARYGFLQRTRGLLHLAAGDAAQARAALLDARAILAAARGEGYIGVAEVELDLAELELAAGQPASARTRIARAGPVIEAVAVRSAPQRARLADLRARLDPADARPARVERERAFPR